MDYAGFIRVVVGYSFRVGPVTDPTVGGFVTLRPASVDLVA
jgi:hypothetical protein